MRAEPLLRLFPRAWRVRYGEEFLATAGNQSLGTQQVVDIVACAIDAWTSSEVRRAAREVRADLVPEGEPMTKRCMTVCGNAGVEWNRRDAWLAAATMIGGSILFSAAGILAKRYGSEVTGQVILGLAFPASLLLSFPFLYLKGKSWRTQLVLVGVPLLVLVAIGILSHYI